MRPAVIPSKPYTLQTYQKELFIISVIIKSVSGTFRNCYAIFYVKSWYNTFLTYLFNFLHSLGVNDDRSQYHSKIDIFLIFGATLWTRKIFFLLQVLDTHTYDENVLFVQACAQYFQKVKLLENKSFGDKNGGKTRLTLWCHISNYKITLNLHVYMYKVNKELQKNISDGKGANLGQYHI